MDRKNLAFDRMNFILLAVGMVVVIIGFILMSGGGTDDNTFNPEIFSAMRHQGCPGDMLHRLLCRWIYAIMRKPKDNGTENEIELDNEEQKL